MADTIEQLSKKLSETIGGQAKRFRAASLFVKIALVSVGSTIAAIAQFVQFPPAGPTSWQVVGIASSLVVAIGGFFVVITEENAPSEIALAQSAIETAREAEFRFEFVGDLIRDQARFIELYQAMNVMRSVIENIASSKISDEISIVQTVLKASERSLAIAMNFEQSDQWTLGIYKAEPSGEVNRSVLRCIAHKRAIECEPSAARIWKEGTGISGVCYSNGDEIIVPDLQADGMSAVFGTSANEARDYDNDRYRSMVAVPIKVDGLDKPWGVIAATNDRVNHFSPKNEDGLKPEEGARALAGMVALAVAVARRKDVTAESA